MNSDTYWGIALYLVFTAVCIYLVWAIKIPELKGILVLAFCYGVNEVSQHFHFGIRIIRDHLSDLGYIPVIVLLTIFACAFFRKPLFGPAKLALVVGFVTAIIHEWTQFINKEGDPIDIAMFILSFFYVLRSLLRFEARVKKTENGLAHEIEKIRSMVV